jgi:hypothetical protein
MSGFVVFVDKISSVDPKVHRDDCFYYLNRKKEASTTVWYGPYVSFSEAWKICFHDAQSQGKIPQTHECAE